MPNRPGGLGGLLIDIHAGDQRRRSRPVRTRRFLDGSAIRRRGPPIHRRDRRSAAETAITDGPQYSWDFQQPNEYRRPAFFFQSSEQTGHLDAASMTTRSSSAIESSTEVGELGADRPDDPLSFGHTLRRPCGRRRGKRRPDTRTIRTSPCPPTTAISSSSFPSRESPTSLRRLPRAVLSPVVRCSESCQVEANVTLRSKSKGKFRTIKFGGATGAAGPRPGVDRRQAVEARKAALRKAERVSVRIELTASPSDGDGDRAEADPHEQLKKRR